MNGVGGAGWLVMGVGAAVITLALVALVVAGSRLDQRARKQRDAPEIQVPDQARRL